MLATQLPGTELTVSRFSFGTASLHHLTGAATQIEHLLSAAEAGFTHFDTAPLYGFGAAESALGAAFGGRDDITIATKVGLYPPGGADQGRFSTLTRKAVGKVVRPLSRAMVDLSTDRASQSVEASLRRLRRDSLDLLLLHEPDMQHLDADEWQRWLEDIRDKVSWIGVAGPASRVEPFLTARSPLAQVVQVRDGLVTHEADLVFYARRSLQLTYGYFSSDGGQLSGDEILKGALRRNPTGSVLVTTRNRDRLRTFGRIGAETPEQQGA